MAIHDEPGDRPVTRDRGLPRRMSGGFAEGEAVEPLPLPEACARPNILPRLPPFTAAGRRAGRTAGE